METRLEPAHDLEAGEAVEEDGDVTEISGWAEGPPFASAFARLISECFT